MIPRYSESRKFSLYVEPWDLKSITLKSQMSTFRAKKRQVCLFFKQECPFVIFGLRREFELYSKFSKSEIKVCSATENIFILKRPVRFRSFIHFTCCKICPSFGIFILIQVFYVDLIRKRVDIKYLLYRFLICFEERLKIEYILQ